MSRLLLSCKILHMENLHPDPMDNSVLYDQENHILEWLWSGKVNIMMNEKCSIKVFSAYAIKNIIITRCIIV